jgi:hypothetical protein
VTARISSVPFRKSPWTCLSQEEHSATFDRVQRLRKHITISIVLIGGSFLGRHIQGDFLRGRQNSPAWNFDSLEVLARPRFDPLSIRARTPCPLGLPAPLQEVPLNMPFARRVQRNFCLSLRASKAYHHIHCPYRFFSGGGHVRSDFGAHSGGIPSIGSTILQGFLLKGRCFFVNVSP